MSKLHHYTVEVHTVVVDKFILIWFVQVLQTCSLIITQIFLFVSTAIRR